MTALRKTFSKFAQHRPLRIAALLLGVLFAVAAPPRAADAGDKTIRVGYQKYGTLILVKSKGALEEKLKPLGVITQRHFYGADFERIRPGFRELSGRG